MKNKTLGFILIIILWQGIYMLEIFPPMVFPSMIDIFHALVQAIKKGEIFSELFYSIKLILYGLLLGSALALLMSFLSIKSKALNSLFNTMITIAHPLPGIALLPLVILWFGTGIKSILFIIVHSVLWPVLLNFKTGFKSIPSIYGDVSHIIGVKGFNLLKDIYIPASMPYIIAGLRIAWARAWRALISAEMIFGAAGGTGGIGWYIFKKRVFMDTTGIFAGLVVIIFIGIVVEDIFIQRLENITVTKWGMTR